MTSHFNPIDAIKGVQHITTETVVHHVQLEPYEHLTPHDVPQGLSIKIYNMSPTKVYVVKICEIVESVELPKEK